MARARTSALEKNTTSSDDAGLAATSSQERFLPAISFVVVLAYALYASSKWVMLADNSSVGTDAVFLSRFLGLGTYGVMALLYRHRTPDISRLFTVMLVLIAVYMVLSVVAPVFGVGVLENVVVVISAAAYGVASPLFFLICIQVFVSFSPDKGAVLIVLAQLMTNCLMLLFTFIDEAVSDTIRLFFLLAATALLFWCVRVPLRKPGVLEIPLDIPAEDTNEKGSSKDKPASALFPANVPSWVLFLLAGAVFSWLFGIIAQVSSTTGGSFGLYDPITDVVLIVIDALLLAFMCLYGTKYGFKTALVIVTVLYAMGLFCYSFVWQSGSPLGGALVRGGFDCSNVLLWVLLARKCHEDPVHTYCYFGLYRFVASVYPARLLGVIIMGGSVATTEMISNISAVGMLVICLCCLAMVVLMNATEANHPVADTQPAETAPAIPVIDETVLHAQQFSERYQLSTREYEVLLDIMRGYTRKRIAEHLYLSPETVKSYVARLYTKVGVTSKQDLINMVEEYCATLES